MCVVAIHAVAGPYAIDAQAAKRVADKIRWQLPTSTHLPMALLPDASRPEIVYAALKTGGVAVLDTRRKPPRIVAHLGRGRFRLDAMNLAQHGSRLYVALGDFFRPADHAGLAVIDVSTPTSPVVDFVWRSPTPMRGAAAVATDGVRAYLGGMHFGVLSFDVSNPRQVRHLATYRPDPNFPRPTPPPTAVPNARGLALDNGLLYVAYDAGGLRVLDVTTPGAPRQVGRYLNHGMAHKQQAYNNLVIRGHHAFIAVDYAGLEVVDLRNPRQPRLVGWWNPWNAERPSNFWFNSPGHANQLVYADDEQRVYLSAGDSELAAVDVSKPSRPRLVASFGGPRNGRGAWGLARTGRRVYLAYIRAIIPFNGQWNGVVGLALRPER